MELARRTTIAAMCILAVACGNDSEAADGSGDADGGTDADAAADADGDVDVESEAADADADADADGDADADADGDADADADGDADSDGDGDGGGDGTIGAAGGTVTGPDGVTLEIPPGALDHEVTFSIAAEAGDVDGIEPLGAMYEFLPAGTVFALPATVTMPYDAAGGAGHEPAIAVWWSDSTTGPWAALAGVVDVSAHEVTGATTHLSHGQSGYEPPRPCTIPVDCDDGFACTTDTCDTGRGLCVNAPSDAACDNGDACDGAESCSAASGCVAGTAVRCDDAIACTRDSCAPATGACSSTPDDTLCSPAGWTCELAALGCVPPPPTCTGATYTGDVSIYDDAAMAALAGYSRIAGDLSLFDTGRAITSLVPLACLTEVDGTMWIGLRNLPTLYGLNGLTRVGSILIIAGSNALTDLEPLSALSSVWELRIYENTRLQSLRGLGSLTSAGILTTYHEVGIEIRDNPALTSLAGLEGLTDFSGHSISVHDNPALASLEGLRNLTSIDQLVISGNNALVDLTGLDSLTTAYFGLSVEDNARLTSLHGLEALRTVGGLGIGGPALASLEALAGLTTVDGGFDVYGTGVLRNLHGLEGLTTVRGSVQFEGNDALDDLSGLANLRWIGDELRFGDNAALRTATLAGLEQVGYDSYFDCGGVDGHGCSIIIDGSSVLEQVTFPALVRIQDAFLIGDGMAWNPLLVAVHAPALTEVRQLNVNRNSSLRTLDFAALPYVPFVALFQNDGPLDDLRFPSLTRLTCFHLAYNSAITDLTGFGALARVEGLDIEDNDALVSLDGFNAVTVTDPAWDCPSPYGILVNGNDALVDLGLDSLAELGEGGGSVLSVINNTTLPTCEPQRVRDQLTGPADDAFCVAGNLADACFDDLSGC
ncbi:MAG: hypothetical protein HY905_23495 [Deltaproteobacteria bacterium]|nr:hypothetical protein [Deltaproteobacteria bacterium]